MKSNLIKMLYHDFSQKRAIQTKKKLSPLRPVIIKKNKKNIIETTINSFINDICLEIKNTAIRSIDSNLKKKEFYDYKVLSEIGDYLGPVVTKDGNFFKFIKDEQKDSFEKLYYSGVLQVFAKHGYVPSFSVSEYFSQGFCYVLELEKIDFDTSKKNNEIEFDFEIFICLLNDICRKNNVVMLDPHYFNVGISKGKIIYFDFGSFKYVDNVDHYTDTSIVYLGLYKRLFSYFPESVLCSREIDNLRFGYTYNDYNDKFFEFRKYKNKFLRFHFFNSSYNVFKSANMIFNLYKCRTIDVCIVFDYDPSILIQRMETKL